MKLRQRKSKQPYPRVDVCLRLDYASLELRVLAGMTDESRTAFFTTGLNRNITGLLEWQLKNHAAKRADTTTMALP